MDMKYKVAAIVIMCVVVLLIGALKRKTGFLAGIAVRIIAGFICVYFTNMFLASQGVDLAVGMNFLTAAALGALGIGGYFLLYGILFLQFLV